MSSSFPTEVLGYGSEGSGTEVSVSVPHPAEVLECPAEGSGADWTISFFSEFEIVLAAVLFSGAGRSGLARIF